MYLDALFEVDPSLGTDYGDLHVDLFAEFDRQRLMKFLRASTFYDLEKVSNSNTRLFSSCAFDARTQGDTISLISFSRHFGWSLSLKGLSDLSRFEFRTRNGLSSGEDGKQ
jgi:hypothetical protein